MLYGYRVGRRAFLGQMPPGPGVFEEIYVPRPIVRTEHPSISKYPPGRLGSTPIRRQTNLIHARADNDFWGAEFLPDAVEFVSETLGINSFPSCLVPEDLRCDERFDVIFLWLS